MGDAIVVQNLGKQFRRYHPDRPWTLHEALLRGLRNLRPAECFWGLRDVSFSVSPGRTVGVVGPNGAGKSTLLRLLGGVGRPDEGTVTVHGRISALLGLGVGFHADLTGRENAFVNGVIHGLTRREVAKQFDSIVAFSELEEFIDNPLRTYSTGMQMRLAFAVAVHVEPEILLIDEVLAVGDLAFQRKCLDRIAQFKAKGCTIVLVSHDTTLVRELCDEGLWLREGRLVTHGSVDVMVDQYVAEVDRETSSRSSAACQIPADSTKHELRLNENRFGSLEVEITAVRLLNSQGVPTAEINSGEPLSIEIKYSAPQLIHRPIFQVYLTRDDGLICCDISTQTALDLSTTQGEGRILLHLERLDLNGGLYYVDVGCYSQDWSCAYDYHQRTYPLVICGGGGTEAALHPPSRWEIRGVQTFGTTLPTIKTP